MPLHIGDAAPDFTAETPFPRLDRRRVGGAVFASKGLHAGLHH